MSEIRHDPLSSQWVIIAPERLERPGVEPLEEKTPVRAVDPLCPFCPGNEKMTPPEIVALRPSGTWNDDHWTCRIVPNRFPALQVEPQMKKMGVGLYDWIAGVGGHEVIIDSRRHIVSSAELSEQEWFDSFLLLQQRINDLRNDFRLLSLLYIKNQGTGAGATVSHSHAQILALPIVAPQLEQRLNNGLKYEHFHGRCGYCDRLAQEIREELRLIWNGEKIVAYEPYASLFPFGSVFQPKEHEACFERASRETLSELARSMKRLLVRMKDLLGDRAMQWVLYTAPLQDRKWDAFFDWHLEMRPVLYPLGGVEWGSGLAINPVSPELAAEKLRL